jgi:hypothetical protein
MELNYNKSTLNVVRLKLTKYEKEAKEYLLYIGNYPYVSDII